MLDDTREIDGGDVQCRCIEADIVKLGKMPGQQADESDEDFFDPLWDGTVSDGLVLGILQVKQEDGIEHPDNFLLVDVIGVQVPHDFTHLGCQVLCCLMG